MRKENVNQLTNDEGILAVFNAASIAADSKREYDAMQKEIFDPDEPLKIPGWIYAAGAIGLIALFRR